MKSRTLQDKQKVVKYVGYMYITLSKIFIDIDWVTEKDISIDSKRSEVELFGKSAGLSNAIHLGSFEMMIRITLEIREFQWKSIQFMYFLPPKC